MLAETNSSVDEEGRLNSDLNSMQLHVNGYCVVPQVYRLSHLSLMES